MDKVILCVGHHEKRQGAVSSVYEGVSEYNQATIVCGYVESILSNVKVCRGTLHDKVKRINNTMPSIAVDLHFNADNDHVDPKDRDDSRGKGTMVMYAPGNIERRRQAASASDMLSRGLFTVNNGAHEGWYWGGDAPGTIPDYFLKHTAVPAFIFEPIYIDNAAEAKHWFIEGRYRIMAEVVADAIDDLVRRVCGHV